MTSTSALVMLLLAAEPADERVLLLPVQGTTPDAVDLGSQLDQSLLAATKRHVGYRSCGLSSGSVLW